MSNKEDWYETYWVGVIASGIYLGMLAGVIWIIGYATVRIIR